MQIFENNKIIFPIYNRALCLAISKDFAHKKNGKINVAEHQNSEQLNRRRELLPLKQKHTKIKSYKNTAKNTSKLKSCSSFLLV